MRTSFQHPPRSFHEALDQAFRLYVGHFPTLTRIAAWLILPAGLLLSLSLSFLPAVTPLPLLLLAMVHRLASGALALATIHLQNRHPTTSSVIGELGIRRASALVMALIVQCLLVVGPALVCAGCLLSLNVEETSEGPGGVVLIGLLLCLPVSLLLIPLTSLRVSLMAQVIVHEHCKVLASLEQSRRLSKYGSGRVVLVGVIRLMIYLLSLTPGWWMYAALRVPVWLSVSVAMLGLLIAVPFATVNATYLYDDIVLDEGSMGVG